MLDKKNGYWWWRHFTLIHSGSPLLDDPDWWCIAAVRTLTLERHVRILLYKLGRVGNFRCCGGECTAFVHFYCSVTPMVMMITIVVHAVTQFELWAVSAGPYARCTLLIAITNATVLDWKKLDMSKSLLTTAQLFCTHRCCWCHHVGQGALGKT